MKFLSMAILLMISSTVQALTLSEAMQTTILHNPALLNEAYEDEKAQLQVAASQEAFIPTLTLDAVSAYQDSQSSGIDHGVALAPHLSLKTKRGTTYDWTIRQHVGTAARTEMQMLITQPLMKGASKEVVTNRLENAQDDIRLQKLNKADLIQSIQRQTVQAYTGLWLSKNQLDLSIRRLHLSEEQLNTIRMKVQAGILAPYNINQAQAQVEQMSYYVRQQTSTMRKASESLWQTMGVDPKADIVAMNLTLPEVSPLKFDHNFYQELSEDKEGERFSITLERLARQYRVACDQKKWLLDLSLGATVQGSSTAGSAHGSWMDFKSQNQRDLTGQLTLKYPLNAPIARHLEVNQLRIQRKQENLRQESFKRENAQRIARLYDEVSLAWHAIDLAGRASQLAQEALDDANEMMLAGRSTFLDVVTMEERAHQMHVAFLQAKSTYLLTVAELEEYCGVIGHEPYSLF